MKTSNSKTPVVRGMPVRQSFEIFDSLFEDFPVKALGSATGLHENTLGTWRKPANHEASQLRYNPLDRILQLCRATSDLRLVEWLCSQVGGYLVTNPPPEGACQSLHQVSARVTQRFAAMIECVAAAVCDETVSDEETVAIRAQWERLKSTVEAFVEGCERRDFATVEMAMRQIFPAPSQQNIPGKQGQCETFRDHTANESQKAIEKKQQRNTNRRSRKD